MPGGAQAYDNGWPVFNGKYVEYPRFRKEWLAYRQTYHGHVRDELVCRSLKERSLASSVRVLVSDIEDLREAWDTLDTCFDWPERYTLEALEPIVKYCTRVTRPSTTGPPGNFTPCCGWP